MREVHGPPALVGRLGGHGPVVGLAGVVPRAAASPGAFQVVATEQTPEEARAPGHGPPAPTAGLAQTAVTVLSGPCLPRPGGTDGRAAPLRVHPSGPPFPQDVGRAGKIRPAGLHTARRLVRPQGVAGVPPPIAHLYCFGWPF